MKKALFSLILICIAFAGMANAQSRSTLTVCGDNTTTNEYVPIYGFFCDEKSKCEFIIPAEKLSAMNGGIVSGIKFYLASSNSSNDISATFNVFVKEVNTTTLTGFTGTTDATIVYTSTISIPKSQSNFELDIPFSSNYIYGGGNLLIGVYQTGSSSYNHTYWTGETQSGNTAWQGYGSGSGSARQFLPKTTFTYEISTTPDIILPATATVMTGFTTTLTATTFNVTGTPSITYTSNNTSVATVTGSGATATVTGVSAGNATITATMTYNGNTYTSTCTITVEDPSYCTPGTGNVDNNGISNVTFGTSLVVNNDTPKTAYGDYSNLVGDVEAGTNGFEVAITYKTGYTYGTIIWVDWDDSYSFEGTEVVYAGQSGSANPTTLTATFDVPENALVGNHRMRIIGADMALDSYTSSISAAASVDPCGSFNYSTCHDYTLLVIAPSTDPSITLSPATATVFLDETATLTAIVRNVTNPTITYTSSNTSVATVSGNGTTATVTGVAAGTATITASMTVSGTTYTSTSTITVATDPCAKTIPYTYGFEDESEFSCWSAVDCETDTEQGLSGIVNYYPNSGSYAFWFSSYCGNTDPQYLISPALSGVQDGVHVEFDYAIVDFSSGAPETFKVGYSTTNNNVSSFTWSEEITCTSSTYEHYSANFMGQVKYIAVQYTSADSYYLMLDDFIIEEAPSCLEPTNIVASNETTTSATISWTAGGSETEWDIYFTTNPSDVPTASTTPSFSGLTTNSFNTIDNNFALTPATTYYVYVRSACSSTEASAWSTLYTFNTECDGMSLPYSETFEAGDLSVCWTIINESPVYMSTSVSSTDPYEGTYHLLLDRRTTQSHNQIIVLPEVSSNYALSNCEVSFYAMLVAGSTSGSTASGRTLTVGVMTDPYDVSTFVAVGSAVEPGTSYAQYTFDLSSYTGDGQYIAIKHDATSNGYTYIDNLEVTVNAYTKDITAYSTEEGVNDGWYFIASPVTEDITPSANNGFLTSEYDLYYFNQNGDSEGKEWINYEDTNNGDFDIENGKGYLYASSTNTTLTFTGTPYSGNTKDVTLTYSTTNGDVNMHGWNLVGNPFAETAYINIPFYTLNGGSEYEENAAGTAIDPMQGVLVHIGESDPTTLTFSTTAPGKSSNLSLNVTDNGKLIDRAIVSFGQGHQLPKFQLNPNHTKVYMPVNGNDFAVVSADNQGEMPVNFKAEKNGNYTISFSNENVEFGYLHLIDNMTGADIDLLETPSYSFDAKVTDYASRFKLVFAAGSNNDDSFACYYNGNIVINNEGSAIVNIIDVLGRTISSQNINGSENVSINAKAGVYTLQLIQGENVKTQKIVVE